MSNESTDPLDADSIIEVCLYVSFDSIRKSFPEYFWSTLYGKVFLTKEELEKSKS